MNHTSDEAKTQSKRKRKWSKRLGYIFNFWILVQYLDRRIIVLRAVFILESLEGIKMNKLLTELGLVASKVSNLLSFLLRVKERATKSLKMPEKPAAKDQLTTKNNFRPGLVKFY